jgi:acetyl esterase/lipase
MSAPDNLIIDSEVAQPREATDQQSVADSSISEKKNKGTFQSFVKGLTSALTPSPILHLRPSWNTTFATSIQLLRTVARTAPRDINTLRLITDHAIPTWLPTVPTGVRMLKSKNPLPDGEWFYPAARGRGFDLMHSPNKPTFILYLHGGAFCCCNSGTHRGLLTRLVHRTQATLFSVNYRRPPEFPFPTPVEDCVLAYQHLLELISTATAESTISGASSKPPTSTSGSDVDLPRIFIAGDSAGGNLVVSTLLRIAKMGLPLPVGGVLLSPWVDLTDLGTNPSWSLNKDIDYLPLDLAALFADSYLKGGKASKIKKKDLTAVSLSAPSSEQATMFNLAVSTSSSQFAQTNTTQSEPASAVVNNSSNSDSSWQSSLSQTELTPEALSPLFYGMLASYNLSIMHISNTLMISISLVCHVLYSISCVAFSYLT